MNINKYKEIIDYFLTEIKYNAEDGNFYWVKPRKGRQLGRPAGTVNHNGYTQIKYEGQVFTVSRLVWYLHTGELPEKAIGYKDGNPRNTRWYNLKLVSEFERTVNFRNATADNNSPITGVEKKVKRPTFTDEEVTKAIEDCISDKTLVNGVYV